METKDKLRAAITLTKTADPSACPAFVEQFYDDAQKIYYGMTSNNTFTGREQGLIIALASLLEKMDKRIADLESRLNAPVQKPQETAPDPVKKRGPGRPKKQAQFVGA